MTKPLSEQELSVLAIGKLLNELLERQKGVVDTRDEIDRHFHQLSLSGDRVESQISVSDPASSDPARLRQLLEKLDLTLSGKGKLGLGSNNLLFMACELLLLAQEDEAHKLLLIEEPEAHLQPRRDEP